MSLRAPPNVARRRTTSATVWDVLFGIDLVALTAAGALSVYAAFALDLTGDVTKADVWAQTVLSLLAFLVVPVGWAVATRVGGWRGALRFLGLDRFGARTFGEGVLVAVAAMLAVIVLVLAYVGLFGEPDESPVAEGLAGLLDPALIVALSFVAGFGEEVFFRGIVQGGILRWASRRNAPAARGWARGAPTGGAPHTHALADPDQEPGRPVGRVAATVAVLVQAVLFAAAHAGYDAILNALVPLVIGIGFGLVYLWRRNLWVVIIAHTLYDLVALSLASLDIG